MNIIATTTKDTQIVELNFYEYSQLISTLQTPNPLVEKIQKQMVYYKTEQAEAQKRANESETHDERQAWLRSVCNIYQPLIEELERLLHNE